MEDYNEIKAILKHRRDFKASDELRTRINATLDAHTSERSLSGWFFGLGASVVAAAILLLVFIPSGLSAKDILRQALTSLHEAGLIEMTVDIRTRPMENFRYINLDDGFVSHRIDISRTDSTMHWRIDKGGRTAVGNDTHIYNWIDNLKIGWRSEGDTPAELLGYLATLLSPESILDAELRQCLDDNESGYELTRNRDEIILTVRSRPKGNFMNPYMLNASIGESENIRQYVFETESNRLKSASVKVVHDGIATEVLKITSITYNASANGITALPSDIDFIDVTPPHMPGLAALNPTEAASIILKAFEKWDSPILDATIHSNLLQSVYRNDLQGAILLSVGRPFNSGNENTIFVPYTLRLADGSIKNHNLAMQKNQTGAWIVVGGL